MMRYTKIIAIILVAIQVLPLRVVLAGKGSKTSIVVVPVHDGVNDNEADAAAESVRSSLGTSPGLYVVDKKKIDSVLRYYDSASKPVEMKNIEQWLTSSKENYYRLNYIEAKSLAGKVVSSIKSNPQLAYENGKILLDAYLTLGIISKSMGNIGEARQAFREALRLDPEYKLDSRAFPPSLVNVFENVRSSLDIIPNGSIRVASNPKVADVYLDGILRGVTPLTLENVSEGKHYLKIGANKYKSAQMVVNVKSGQTLKVKERLHWTAGKKAKLDGKNYATAEGGLAQVDEGLRIANLLRVDKAVLIDVDSSAVGKEVIRARMVDAKYRTGHKPIIMPYQNGDGSIGRLSSKLISQTHANIAGNPQKYSDPLGKGDPVLLGSKKRSKISKPVLFGVLGGVLAAGLAGGLAAALAGGGGGGGDDAGSVNVTFK